MTYARSQQKKSSGKKEALFFQPLLLYNAHNMEWSTSNNEPGSLLDASIWWQDITQMYQSQIKRPTTNQVRCWTCFPRVTKQMLCGRPTKNKVPEKKEFYFSNIKKMLCEKLTKNKVPEKKELYFSNIKKCFVGGQQKIKFRKKRNFIFPTSKNALWEASKK